jgi:hypothetical protein
VTSITMRINGRWMPSLLQSHLRCSSCFVRSGLLRRLATPSLRHASAATTLQALRKEWENLAFKPGEDVDEFALHLNTLQQKMVQFGDDTYSEERAIEKLFRCIPEKCKQIARSIKSLLDLSTMSIEEAIGHLKVIDDDEPQPLSGPITVSGKLHLTRE